MKEGWTVGNGDEAEHKGTYRKRASRARRPSRLTAFPSAMHVCVCIFVVDSFTSSPSKLATPIAVHHVQHLARRPTRLSLSRTTCCTDADVSTLSLFDDALIFHVASIIHDVPILRVDIQHP